MQRSGKLLTIGLTVCGAGVPCKRRVVTGRGWAGAGRGGRGGRREKVGLGWCGWRLARVGGWGLPAGPGAAAVPVSVQVVATPTPDPQQRSPGAPEIVGHPRLYPPPMTIASRVGTRVPAAIPAVAPCRSMILEVLHYVEIKHAQHVRKLHVVRSFHVTATGAPRRTRQTGPTRRPEAATAATAANRHRGLRGAIRHG
jgi:hypothetical protein